MSSNFDFAQALLNWFDVHGRFNLPWQQNINPYRVWISEIMLQQTQVDTVIPYFQRFMSRYPEVHALAQADVDEVLHMWTGLGYYARARNLHKCAIHVSEHLQGKFPHDLEALQSLPGIGPSTAAAISSIAFEQPDAIMDGNVKRVLTRFLAIEGWPGQKKIETELWQHARRLMPDTRCRDYTQAIMDLGATLCTRSNPSCDTCPMQLSCKAHALGQPTKFPYSKPKKDKPVKSCQMLLIYNDQSEIALYQRPPSGIWGGLWSLPEIELDEHAEDYVEENYGRVRDSERLPTVKHVFSHYTLMIHPQAIWLESETQKTRQVMESETQLWYNPHFPQELGLAAPVKKLIHG